MEYIAKVKARTPYEFDLKSLMTVAAGEGLVVGTRLDAGQPPDGHTVNRQIELIGMLTGTTPKIATVDRGYRDAFRPAPALG